LRNQTQATLPGQAGPAPHRTTARVVGVLYLAGMVVGMAGNILVQSIITAPDHLAAVSASSLALAVGAMLVLMAGVWDAAHGVLMFPVLKPHGERVAIGYLGYRLVDAAFIGLWVLFLLLEVPLGREYLKAGADTVSLQALSDVSVQASLYAYNIAMLFVGIAGVLLCATFYRVRLVPRAIAAWGLVGYAVHLGGAVGELLGFNLGLVPVIPGGLWELFIGVWLIAKGFNSSTVPAERTVTPTVPILTPREVAGATA
jgi:hypothetical protein